MYRKQAENRVFLNPIQTIGPRKVRAELEGPPSKAQVLLSPSTGKFQLLAPVNCGWYLASLLFIAVQLRFEPIIIFYNVLRIKLDSFRKLRDSWQSSSGAPYVLNLLVYPYCVWLYTSCQEQHLYFFTIATESQPTNYMVVSVQLVFIRRHEAHNS